MVQVEVCSFLILLNGIYTNRYLSSFREQLVLVTLMSSRAFSLLFKKFPNWHLLSSSWRALKGSCDEMVSRMRRGRGSASTTMTLNSEYPAAFASRTSGYEDGALYVWEILARMFPRGKPVLVKTRLS